MYKKNCKDCGIEKELELFYVHKQMSDGRLNKCIECVKNRVGKHRDNNIERIKAYDKQRDKSEKRKQIKAEYQKNNKEKCNQIKKRWIENNPEKRKAHNLVWSAIRNGKLQKEPCSICTTCIDVEAHHDDYSKPLEVRWLCTKCHGEEHWGTADASV